MSPSQPAGSGAEFTSGHGDFEAALRNSKLTAALGEHSVLQISDTTVVVTGFDTIVGVFADKPLNLAGRDTFVIAKRAADWQIVHFHRSAMPN